MHGTVYNYLLFKMYKSIAASAADLLIDQHLPKQLNGDPDDPRKSWKDMNRPLS